jgi:hypothetical protein
MLLLGGLAGQGFLTSGVVGQTTAIFQDIQSSSSILHDGATQSLPETTTPHHSLLYSQGHDDQRLVNPREGRSSKEYGKLPHHTRDDRSLEGGCGAVVVNGKQLQQAFQVAKAKMIQKLQSDYGADLFEATFMTSWNGGTERVTQGRRFFLSPSVPKDRFATNENEGPSWDRLVRRMAVKILQAQQNNEKIPFIWSTGGHSAAVSFQLVQLFFFRSKPEHNSHSNAVSSFG